MGTALGMLFLFSVFVALAHCCKKKIFIIDGDSFPLSSYFHCSLIGYFLGLLTATVSSEVFKAAQPALLYLVPFTLLPLLTMAYLKVSGGRKILNQETEVI